MSIHLLLHKSKKYGEYTFIHLLQVQIYCFVGPTVTLRIVLLVAFVFQTQTNIWLHNIVALWK